jgi:hypothetical protein
MEHDNRNRTITMRFEHGQVKLVMEMPYFLDKSPNYQEAKRALDISAISTVTAYDALGDKNYIRMTTEIHKMNHQERSSLLSVIRSKHPKGLLPLIINKEI